MKTPTALQREVIRSMAVDQAGRLESRSWYSSPLERNITSTVGQLAGLVERGLVTPYGGPSQPETLTPDGLVYAITQGFIDWKRAEELEALLRGAGRAEVLDIPLCPTGALTIASDDKDTGETVVWDWHEDDHLWHCEASGARLDYVELITRHGPLEVTRYAPGHGPAVTPSVFPGGAPVRTHEDGAQGVGPYSGITSVRGGVRFGDVGPLGERWAAEDEDALPMVPRDSLGRPVRPGYVVIWGDRPERWIVASWGRYNGGEEGWEWMLRLERERRTAADREGLQRAHALSSVCRVIERAVDAPESRSTDELLHRLRELVAARQGLASRTGLAVEDAAGDSAEWVGLFDELDYRASNGAYPLPGPWGENR